MEYQIKFGLIDLISKSIAPPPTIPLEPTEFSFNFTIEIKLAPEKKLAVVITNVSILFSTENQVMANFRTHMVFEFPEFEKVFKEIQPTKYDMPYDIEVLLKSVGLSTTRGIIFSEVRGTYLHNAVLPLINLPELIKADRERMSKSQEPKPA